MRRRMLVLVSVVLVSLLVTTSVAAAPAIVVARARHVGRGALSYGSSGGNVVFHRTALRRESLRHCVRQSSLQPQPNLHRPVSLHPGQQLLLFGCNWGYYGGYNRYGCYWR